MRVGVTCGNSARRSAAGGGALPRWSPGRAAWVAGAAVLALWTAGCGLRTAPQPLSDRITPPQGLRAWNRDREVIVAWAAIPDRVVSRWAGIQGYRLSLARLPLGCVDCQPIESRELALVPGSAELMAESGSLLYRFSPPGPPATWRVRLRVRYNQGTSTDAGPLFVDPVGDIPLPILQWERVGPQVLGTNGKPSIRLYWNARRERIVYVLTPTNAHMEQELLYRVNLYGRVPPAPWPELPFTGQPLTGLWWIGPEPFFLNDPTAKSVEYRMRLVDQLGNEGPPSDPVSIPIAKGLGS